MNRLHSNFQQGTLSSAVASSGATSATSDSFASLPTLVLNGGYYAVTLDPEGVDGNPEIVHVTVHTAASTSVTIVRGQEGTTARAHASDITWRHTANAADFTELARLVNTDGDPGRTIYVGSTDPTVAHTPEAGDIWFEDEGL